MTQYAISLDVVGSAVGPPCFEFHAVYTFFSEPNTGVAKVFDAAMIDEARSKAVYIYSEYFDVITKEKKYSSGSGFAVDNGEYILTCAHVVMNTNIVNIQLTSNLRLSGKVTDINESIDLAIIKLPDGMTISPFKFEDCLGLLKDGDPVIAIGSPDSVPNSITDGIISNLRRPGREISLNEDIEYVQHTATVYRGNSGGPLVNPATGNLIAVNSNCRNPAVSFGISATVAEEFIKSANRNPTCYTIGVSMLTVTNSEDVNIQILKHFSVPETFAKAVVLTEVHEGYPAYTANLSPGDMVVRIDGRDNCSAHDVYKAVMFSSGLQLTIDIYRQSAHYTADLTPIRIQVPN